MFVALFFGTIIIAVALSFFPKTQPIAKAMLDSVGKAFALALCTLACVFVAVAIAVVTFVLCLVSGLLLIAFWIATGLFFGLGIGSEKIHAFFDWSNGFFADYLDDPSIPWTRKVFPLIFGVAGLALILLCIGVRKVSTWVFALSYQATVFFDKAFSFSTRGAGVIETGLKYYWTQLREFYSTGKTAA